MKRILSSLLLVAALFAASPAFALSAYANSGATNTASMVATGTSTLTFINVYNPNASVVYIQFFNAASAGAVTVGTTPPTYWIAVSPSIAVSQQINLGYTFTLGMVIAVTTTPTGSTPPGTACPIVLFTAI